MLRSLLVASAAAAALLAACSPKTEVASTEKAGPAVSTSETPRNEAVDTTPTTGETAQTPGANSFTEEQARGAIASAGYTDVGALAQASDGIWRGKAMKGGASVDVSVDYKGAVTPQ